MADPRLADPCLADPCLDDPCLDGMEFHMVGMQLLAEHAHNNTIRVIRDIRMELV